MMLQDRAGNSPQYLATEAQRFIAAASQRPEIGKVYTLYRANVPQKSILVDKAKVDKLGLDLDQVNTTISTLLGGYFVNNFNQFGRQYKTYVMADQEYRMKPDDLQQFYSRNLNGGNGPAGNGCRSGRYFRSTVHQSLQYIQGSRSEWGTRTRLQFIAGARCP
jgi:HAE1 family hydrophobic/amphiphilic exporter-1